MMSTRQKTPKSRNIFYLQIFKCIVINHSTLKPQVLLKYFILPSWSEKKRKFVKKFLNILNSHLKFKDFRFFMHPGSSVQKMHEYLKILIFITKLILQLVVALTHNIYKFYSSGRNRTSFWSLSDHFDHFMNISRLSMKYFYQGVIYIIPKICAICCVHRSGNKNGASVDFNT